MQKKRISKNLERSFTIIEEDHQNPKIKIVKTCQKKKLKFPKHRKRSLLKVKSPLFRERHPYKETAQYILSNSRKVMNLKRIDQYVPSIHSIIKMNF